MMMRRSLAHHPAWNMRQRPIEVMNDKDVSTLETLTPNDNRRLPTSRMKRIMNPPVALIPGSMSLLRPAPERRISPSQSLVNCIRSGARGRFYNVVDLVNRLEAESRNGRQGRIADYLIRKDFVVLDELGYLPFAQSGGQLLFHLISRLYERTSIIVTNRAPRPANPSLRYCRDRQRKLALQKPRLTTASRSLATALLGGALARGSLRFDIPRRKIILRTCSQFAP